MTIADARTALLRPDLKWAASRFPFALLAAGLLTLSALAAVFNYAPIQWRTVDLIVFMMVLAFLAATAASFATLRARSWLSMTAQGSAFLLGLGLGFVVSLEPYTSCSIILSFACLTSLAAGYATKGGSPRFWQTTISLVANLVLCLVGLTIVLVGTMIILSSIEKLLGLETRKAFEPILIVAGWLGVPLLWLSLTRFCEEPAGEQPVNLLHRVISVVTDGLLIPLMSIYAAVIHVYAGRIAFMAELPKGQIGWIVPTYLVVGYGAYVLAHSPSPLLPRLRALFLRSWLFATLVPLVLLAIATAVRIKAYGVTEERYLLALAAAGFALVAASALVKRPLDLRILPLVAGALALIAAIGPMSARNVTIGSQASRARAIISSVPAERWAQSHDGGLNESQRKELVSILHLLSRREIDLDRVLPQNEWPKELPRDPWRLDGASVDVSFDTTSVSRLGPLTLIENTRIDWKSTAPQVREGAGLSYTLHVNGNILEVSGENAVTRFDVSALLTMEKKSGGNGPRPVFQSIEGRKGELIVEQFTRRHHPTGSELANVWGLIVLY